MIDFELIYAWCRLKEGQKLTNVTCDAGGLTWCGIAKADSADFNGWGQVNNYLVAAVGDLVKATELCLADAMLMTQTHDYYLGRFTKHNLQQLNYQELALQVFYHYWNMGGIALAAFQGFVGVVPDGFIGPETIVRANSSADPSKLVDIFLGWCKQHYIDIVARHPEDAKFLAGWENTCLRSDGK